MSLIVIVNILILTFMGIALFFLKREKYEWIPTGDGLFTAIKVSKHSNVSRLEWCLHIHDRKFGIYRHGWQVPCFLAVVNYIMSKAFHISTILYDMYILGLFALTLILVVKRYLFITALISGKRAGDDPPEQNGQIR